MALVAALTGDRDILKRYFTIHNTQGDSCVLDLFKNKGGAGIAKGDSWRSFVISTGTGYSKIPLNQASWTWAPGPTGDTIFYPQQTFTYTGADSVNGYVVTTHRAINSGMGDSLVVFAEVFSNGPYILPAGGGTVKVTLQIGMN